LFTYKRFKQAIALKKALGDRYYIHLKFYFLLGLEVADLDKVKEIGLSIDDANPFIEYQKIELLNKLENSRRWI
jgi:hypothetical protein